MTPNTQHPPPHTHRPHGSFPVRVDSSRAAALGLHADLDADSIVRAYAEDFPLALSPSLELQPLLPSAGTAGTTPGVVPSATDGAERKLRECHRPEP